MRGFMVCLVALLFLAAPVPAAAEQQPARAIGPHSCQGYPQSAAATDLGAQATVTFMIGVDGAVRDVQAVSSNGRDDVRDHAIRCVTPWRYEPATADGKPIETVYTVKLTWRVSDWDMPQRKNVRRDCAAYRGDGTEKKALLAFVVTASGAVKDAFVAIPSGDAGFDAMAMDCIASWSYRAVMRNTQMVDSAWSTNLTFLPDAKAVVDFAGAHINPKAFCEDGWYPAAALSAKTEGTTVLTFDIIHGGAVDKAAVHRTSGSAALDDAALACAKTWRYAGPKYNDPQVRQPWAVWIVWKYGHAYALQMGLPEDNLDPH